MAEASPIDRIKQKLDIVEEIGAVVPLRKSGKAFRGLCPFHGERTPSFYVFPESGTWKCFGCQEGGDVFAFVMRQQGLDFREAMELLAERAGVAFETGFVRGDAEESAETTARKRLRTLNETAAIWFHHQLLQATEAQYARAYLESRGVNGETLAQWRLGYAPDGDRLATYMQTQGYAPNELVEAGLAREREASRGGGLYDFFRNRVIFPIRDGRGQTIGFGGRELGGGQPKYLNTPQTALFDKSATLYGLDLAREGIKRGNRVVIVEGYMDVVLPHQYGFRNVVACIGSAITEKHIRQIKKLTRRVALALDPDAAGESAMVRGIAVAQEAFDRTVEPVPGQANWAKNLTREQLLDRKLLDKAVSKGYENISGQVRFEEKVDAEITVVRLPAHEDPDEFVRRDPQGWQQAVETAQPLIEFLIDAQTADLDLSTPQGKVEASRRLLPMIVEIRDRTLAADYVGRVASRIKMDNKLLERDLAQARLRLDREAQARPARRSEDERSEQDQTGESVERLGEKSSVSGGPGIGPSYSASGAASGLGMMGTAGRLLAAQAQEEECLGLLIERPMVWAEVHGILADGDFAGTEARAIFAALAAAQSDPSMGSLDPQGFVESLPPFLLGVAQRARGRVAAETLPEGTALAKYTAASAYRLKRTRLNEELAELDYLQRDAEQTNDEDGLRALLRRKLHLLSQRNAIDKASGLQG